MPYLNVSARKQSHRVTQVWLAPTDIIEVFCTPLVRCNYANNLYLAAQFKRLERSVLKVKEEQLCMCLTQLLPNKMQFRR